MQRKILHLVEFFIKWIARFFSIFYGVRFRYLSSHLFRVFISQLYRKEFNSFGANSLLGKKMKFRGLEYVNVGKKTSIGDGGVLTCYKVVNDPVLVIGNNVSIGDDSHITCSNKMIIEDNVLIGKKVTITDNSHGESGELLSCIAPKDRNIYSKGSVIIRNNVWIGDKASIMPGVVIGKNSIIGANSVVTKDIPENSIAVGVPARIISINL